MSVICIGDLHSISNRQYLTRVFPVCETSDMEYEDFENHFSKQSQDIYMTNLSISQIHPLLQFISLTSFEHPPYAKDWIQHCCALWELTHDHE